MDIQKLLIEVKAISERYLQLSKQTGSSFNIFEVLKVKSSEVRLHSAFIAELLNINGSHSQGDKFLKLFLEVVKIKGYNTKQSSIDVEKQIGKISQDKTEGGNIDIILNDKEQTIIIENKIYAPDQEAQLLRYFNYAKSCKFEYIHLFYLTLEGKEPSEASKKELSLHEYRTISYNTEILEWLYLCYTESIALPTIRETINQYIQILKKLTNQITSSEMNQDTINKIIESKGNFESAKLIQSAYNDCIKSIKDDFKNDINKILLDSKYTVDPKIKDDRTLKIQLHAGEDESGFYFAFRLVSKQLENRYSVSYSDFIMKQEAEKIKNGLFSELSQGFKDIKPEIKSSNWSLAWYNPLGNGTRLENIETEKFISFYQNANNRNAFINELLQEVNEIIDQYKNVN